MKFQVRYLILFLLFSVIGGLRWFWMGNLHKNIQLMLVLHFSYYTSMTFRMILSVIFLYMLMILLSTLNVIRHLICGNNQNWLLNLNLTYKTLWTGAGSGLLISMQEKLSFFNLTSVKTLVLLIWKWMGLFLRKNHLLKYWGSLYLLHWIGALTSTVLLKQPPRKLDAWFVL